MNYNKRGITVWSQGLEEGKSVHKIKVSLPRRICQNQIKCAFDVPETYQTFTGVIRSERLHHKEKRNTALLYSPACGEALYLNSRMIKTADTLTALCCTVVAEAFPTH